MSNSKYFEFRLPITPQHTSCSPASTVSKTILQIVFALVFTTLASGVYAVCDPSESSGMDPTECYALLELYNATNGPNWVNRQFPNDPTGWEDGPTCSARDSITCGTNIDDVNHVTMLSLSEWGLEGTLPGSVFSRLPYLQELRLGQNALRGNIPTQLAELPNLYRLGLSDNAFVGTIPEGLLGERGPSDVFYQKINIFLGNNQLSGNLPQSLGRDDIFSLWVEENPALYGPVPHTYTQQDAMYIFHFEDTQICEPQDLEMQAWLDGVGILRGTDISCDDPPVTYTVSTSVSGGSGSIAPASRIVTHGETAAFDVVAESGYVVDSVSGCGGSWSGNSPYQTGPVIGDCLVTASFIPGSAKHTVSAAVDAFGSLDITSVTVNHGASASFRVLPNTGYVTDSTMGGNCPAGSWNDFIYTTGPITATCDISFTHHATPLPPLQLDMDVIQTIRDPIPAVTGKPLYVRAYVTCPTCTEKRTVDVKIILKLDDAIVFAGVRQRTLILDQAITVDFMRQNPIYGRSHDVNNYSFDLTIAPGDFEVAAEVVKKISVSAEYESATGIAKLEETKTIRVLPISPVVIGVLNIDLVDRGVSRTQAGSSDLYNSLVFTDLVFPGMDFNLLGNFSFELDALEDKYQAGFRLTSKLAKHHVINLAHGVPNYVGSDYLFGLYHKDSSTEVTADADPYWSPHSMTGYVAHGSPGMSMARMTAMNLGLGMPAWEYKGSYREGACVAGSSETNFSRVGVHDYVWGFNDTLTHADGYTKSTLVRNRYVSDDYIDFMSNCRATLYSIDPNDSNRMKNPRRWISTMHHDILAYVLRSDTSLPLPHSTARDVDDLSGEIAAGGVGSYRLVTAGIEPDGPLGLPWAVDLLSQPLESLVALPRSLKPDDGSPNRYCVESRDAQDNTLDSQCFDLDFTDVNAQAFTGVKVQYLQAQLWSNPATTSIVIRNGGEDQWRFEQSASNPQVTGGSLNGAAGIHGSRIAMNVDAIFKSICWTATDADGDSLKYQVEYSPNSGGYWETLAVDLQQTCFEVDLSSLTASDAGKFRISAMDGFNASQPFEIAGTVIVPDQGPQIFLTHSESVTNLSEDELFVLSASAFDKEDGIIDSSSLKWKDAQGLLLGTGSVTVTATRTPESYVVSTTDSAGNFSEKTVWLSALGCGGNTATLEDLSFITGSVTTCQTTDSIDTLPVLEVEADAILNLLSAKVTLGKEFRIMQGGSLRVTAN